MQLIFSFVSIFAGAFPLLDDDLLMQRNLIPPLDHHYEGGSKMALPQLEIQHLARNPKIKLENIVLVTLNSLVCL